MNPDVPGSNPDREHGLRRVATGSTVGLAAGVVGLALPVTMFVLASYAPSTLPLSGSELLQLTAVLALAGALLFGISMTLYRWGFWSMQKADPRFWIASGLCLLGLVGVILILLPMLIAFTASDAMAACIEGAPTKAMACLRSAAPLASVVGIAGIWLIWLGGLGIVVGIGLTGICYRQGWLGVGAGMYAVLLLGLVVPILGLLFPIGGFVYPILALPVLVLLAPAMISHGSHQLLRGPVDPQLGASA